MPDEQFWRERFKQLGVHGVGPGDTSDESALEEHRQYFVQGASAWITQLKGPVLDFGCGTGRWVADLPRPYLGLDLLPEHIAFCRSRYQHNPDTDFALSLELASLPENYFKSIFTCTVLQHIVEKATRQQVIENLSRILSGDGNLLSIEWAEGQKEFDWCTAVRRTDFVHFFHINKAGEVIESGRRHTIWLLKRKSTSRFLFW